MKTNSIIIALVIVLVTSVSASAQKGLNIASLLGGNLGKQEGNTEIVVTGDRAASVKLDVYHSLSTSHMSQVAAIERAVTADGAQAVTKEVEYRNGKLYYGFYVMQRRNGKGRFIFYLNQSLAREHPQDKVTLIYMEGDVGRQWVKSLIKQ